MMTNCQQFIAYNIFFFFCLCVFITFLTYLSFKIKKLALVKVLVNKVISCQNFCEIESTNGTSCSFTRILRFWKKTKLCEINLCVCSSISCFQGIFTKKKRVRVNLHNFHVVNCANSNLH